MSLATALKSAVADAVRRRAPTSGRLWVAQIITGIGAQLTVARLEGRATTGCDVDLRGVRSASTGAAGSCGVGVAGAVDLDGECLAVADVGTVEVFLLLGQDPCRFRA